MADRHGLRVAGRAAKAVIALELKSEPGRINAAGVALTFLLIVLLAIHAAYEATIARIFPAAGPYSFPVIAVLAVFAGAFLACVLLLALLTPLLRNREGEERDPG